MIILRQKEYSLSDRAKAGLKNIKESGLTGAGGIFGAGIPALVLKNKSLGKREALALGGGALTGVGVGAALAYRSGVKKYDKKQREIELSNQREADFRNSDVYKNNKKFFDLEEKLNKYNHQYAGGDGDEYPSLRVDRETGDICMGYQDSYPRYHWNGKNWEDLTYGRTPRKVSNLKADMLRVINEERDIFSADEWPEVIDHLNNMEKEIKNSIL